MRVRSDKIIGRLRATCLDRELAAGASPETSARHAARARRLASPRGRRALADSWEHVLLTSRRPTGGLPSHVPIRRARVQRAEPRIRELITALRGQGPMPVRGVAMAMTLLTDGRGPIYNPYARDDLAVQVEMAIEHLNPALPLTGSRIDFCAAD